MEISFMENVLSEERQLMKWVGMFQVGISWVGIFRREFSSGGKGEFDGWEFSEVGGGFPRRIFLEPILISNLAESVIMTSRLNLL